MSSKIPFLKNQFFLREKLIFQVPKPIEMQKVQKVHFFALFRSLAAEG